MGLLALHTTSFLFSVKNWHKLSIAKKKFKILLPEHFQRKLKHCQCKQYKERPEI